MHLDDEVALNAVSPQVLAALTAEGVKSTLALPIRHGLGGLGVFWVHSRRRREFSQAEVSLLERLTILAGTAIANAQAHAEEQEARAEVEALLEATESLSVQAAPEAVLRTLIEQAALLLQADRAVYGMERDGHRLIPGHWVRGTWIPDGYEPAVDGVVGRVWDSGLPYLTNDLPNDPNANPQMVRRFGLRSLLAVPLPGAGGESIGVVMLNNSTRPEGFTDRDRRLLQRDRRHGESARSRRYLPRPTSSTAPLILRRSCSASSDSRPICWLSSGSASPPMRATTRCGVTFGWTAPGIPNQVGCRWKDPSRGG
jgi:GAF domain-containing protein